MKVLNALSTAGPEMFIRLGDWKNVQFVPFSVEVLDTSPPYSRDLCSGGALRCEARDLSRMCPAECRVLWYGGGLPREAMRRWMGREGGIALSSLIDALGIGSLVNGTGNVDDADNASGAEGGVFTVESTRASSLLGSVASSLVVLDFEDGRGGDLDRDEFLSLQRSLAALMLAIESRLILLRFKSLGVTYNKYEKLQTSD